MFCGIEDFQINIFQVADLKRELKARGLSSVGIKTELIERLQAHMIGKFFMNYEFKYINEFI